MAVTKMWAVKASLAAPLDYITQDAKTVAAGFSGIELSEDYSHADQMRLREVMDFMGQEKERKELETVIGYVAQGVKTDEEKFVTGINCLHTTARVEMEQVKQQWQKTGGNVCMHCYQSFAPGEVTPELAHTIGLELARTLWSDRFQVVVATHLDREHIHNHFVINSVSFVDGKRFHYGQGAYDLMRVTSDKLCREYSLSVIDRPKRGRQVNPNVYAKAGIERLPPFKQRIKRDIDEAVRRSRSVEDFYRILTEKGYTFQKGSRKYFSLKMPGQEHFTRIDGRAGFGEAYSREGIARRILNGEQAPPSDSGAGGLPEDENVDFRLPDSWKGDPQRNAGGSDAAGRFPGNSQAEQKKITRYKGSFRADRARGKSSKFRRLYLYYCYVFGVFPKRRQGISNVSRREVRRMRDISSQTRLLLTNRIDTLEQLVAYRAGRQADVDRLCTQRKALYNRLRGADEAEHSAVRSQIDALTAQIRQEREQVRLCDDIHERSLRENRAAEAARQQNEEEKINTTKEEESEYGHDTGRRQQRHESEHDFGY